MKPGEATDLTGCLVLFDLPDKPYHSRGELLRD